MNFKRIISTALACVVALSALTACNENVNTDEISDPSAWNRDAKHHWIENEKGKKKEKGAHDLIDNVCVTCESEVWTYEDGSVDIYNYTEYGDFLRLTSYDADGNVTMDTRYEYRYDQNGHIEYEKQYEFDVVVAESEYYVDPDGNSIPSYQVFYGEDGSCNMSEYDGNGNLITEIYRDSEGFEWVTAEYAYTYLSEDDFFMSTKIEYFDDGSKHIIDYNTYGDIIHWYGFDIYGSSEFDMHYEYDYDDDGNKIYSNEYNGSVLTNEYEYAIDAEGNSYCVKETVYNEDESVTYIEYDENLEITSNTTHDASGNVIV